MERISRVRAMAHAVVTAIRAMDIRILMVVKRKRNSNFFK